ncbi:MAG: hypothetical protein JXP34_18030 [Planctomycetes bacterium]|nr:hypothetical protein [Planctomycetota bacterium]
MADMAMGRREFLGAAAALHLGLGVAGGGEPETSRTLPQISIGKHRISRLVAGGNPINGGSHLSRFVDRSMREYFTEERVQEFLGRCRAAGIRAWQSSGTNFEMWDRFRRGGGDGGGSAGGSAGGPMEYISLGRADPDYPATIERAARMGFLGIAHHGEVTDQLFKAGRIEEAREYLKRVRDAGLRVGLSTHMPAVVAYVEEKGWDIDFYMTCVYERHRTREELKELLGYVPIPVREVYLEEDPPRMYEAIRATRKPCLAFKILAAGRLCQSPKQVEAAFETTFRNIKPIDGVIVGMFPRWTDQIEENAALVRRFGA